MNVKKIIIIINLILLSISLFPQTDYKIDSLKLIVENTVDTVKGNALIELGKSHYSKQEFYEAINYIKQALPIFIDNQKKSASLLSFIGSLYYFMGEYSSSLEYYFKGLKIRENIGDIKLIATSYNNIGTTYSNIGQFNEAYTFLNKALQIEKKYNNKENLCKIYNNIGTIASNQEKYKQALDLLLKAKKLMNYADLKKSTLFNNIGLQYLALGNLKDAEDYFIKALEYSKQDNDKYYTAATYLNLGNLYYEKKIYNKSISFYNKSLKISTEINVNNVMQSNYEGLSILYSKLLIPDSVAKYNRLYLTISDSIYNKTTAEKIAELQTLYDYKKQEEEILRLKIEKESIYKEQKLFQLLLILLIIVLISVTLLFYYRLKRIKSDKFIVKQNIKLVSYEEKLDKKDEEEYLNTNKIKYKTSSLDEETKKVIEYSISKIMRKDKVYLNSDFSINDMAKKIDTTRNNISQVINEKFNLNYNNFINEYRVKEAMRLLSNPENNIYTINTIAKKVGFNSISAFNTAFKRFAGVTPSFFIKSMKNT